MKKVLKNKHPISPSIYSSRSKATRDRLTLSSNQEIILNQATVYRILDPLIAQHKQKTKVRNPGSGLLDDSCNTRMGNY